MRIPCFLAAVLWGGLAHGQGIDVNGDFESTTDMGWTEWAAPWSQSTAYDYGWGDEPYEGGSSLHVRASEGSFGVYQEFCVEPGVAFSVSWGWRGRSAGNGWWEVLVVDAPYSYEAVDEPNNHPETAFAAKWESGFGGPFPEPSAEWTDGSFELMPLSDTVTVVLKCGSTEGDDIEAWFDEVTVTHDSDFLEVFGVEPSLGKVTGDDPVRILGRNLLPDVMVELGANELLDPLRLSTCEVNGSTPPGEAGAVDVIVTTSRGAATLVDGFRYVGAPTLASITPDSGSLEGGTEVTLVGENFEPPDGEGIQVLLGSTPLQGLIRVDATTLTGITPAGDGGAVPVTVTTVFGETNMPDAFTYLRDEMRFRRGDCNDDTTVDISDAVCMLNWLFLGGPVAGFGCAAVANTNGDDKVDLSDAVYMLNHLFLGGPALAAPSPDCGPGSLPTDAGECQSQPPSCS